VVIAIITILVSPLLPVLANANAKGLQTSCGSNLKIGSRFVTQS
jgi:hypothetical protein